MDGRSRCHSKTMKVIAKYALTAANAPTKTTRIFRNRALRTFPSSSSLIVRHSHEGVSRAPHRADVPGLARVVRELLAEAAHEHVDRAVERIPVLALHLIEDIAARQDPASAADQQLEKVELRGGERHRLVVEEGRAPLGIDTQRAERPHVLVDAPPP